MALPVAQIMARTHEGVSDDVVAEEKADEAEEMMKEAEDCFLTEDILVAF